jgi:hypothetical protein
MMNWISSNKMKRLIDTNKPLTGFFYFVMFDF